MTSNKIIQIGIIFLIGFAFYLLHDFSILYKGIDDLLFGKRHTLITSLILVPFLFGLVLYIIIGKHIIYPTLLIAIIPLAVNIPRFLYFQLFYDGPKDNIGVITPIVMFVIESVFIYLGALSGSGVFRLKRKDMAF